MIKTLKNQENIDYTHAVEIAPKTYWVGAYLENDPFQCHPYYIDLGKNSILIDPGSMLEIDSIINKVNEIGSIKDIRYIILHHQDPDLCSSVPYLEDIINRKDLMIVTHTRMTFLIKHYGVKSPYYKIDMQNFELNIDGYKLKFFTTPYCHSPGAFVTYDLQTKVLFSSDLFGGLEESWHFYADENYYKEIEGFHMAYMPSKDILNYALRKIENLDIELIAPQHGSIIKREHIKPLIDKMKEMECGLYIEKQYSENLTETIQKLDKIKKEFENSLKDIKSLKRNQDGDYFLTSLLIKPLIVNKINSQNVQIDFVCIQKKSFLFKNQHNHIGGDICFANTIKIHQKLYHLFFNGDAMGKSLQGASGSIVMGTILNSLSIRDFDYIHTPEELLEKIYQEIQNIFLSFDGTMMISGILGIIDEEESMLYYFNAEHPFAILYRNNQASFLDEEITVRKFGFPSDLPFKVQKFYLEENDVVFIGSDGKDDLLISHGEEKVMNHDYRLFLKVIEEKKGKLKEMVQKIYQIGIPTDDISIMRISFKEKDYKREEHRLDSEEIYRLKVKSYIKQKNYEDALALMEGPSEKQPFDILLLRGLCFINLNRNLKALKYLLRANTMNPNHYHLLKLIGIAYFNMKNYRNAKEYWEKALSIKPTRTIKRYIEKADYVIKRQYTLLGKKQGLEQDPEHLKNQFTLEEELEKI
jgi:glyoxylase-like metal-dependent hydrolase (beta-lactamase superfamily II)